MALDLTGGLVFDQTPAHYIIFGNFDSRRFGMHLHKREAPTPEEKAIAPSIPFAQGVVDLSHLRGARIYNNREITYTFYRFYVKQIDANDFQTTIENLIMQESNQVLHDSYEPYFYYRGKCKNVEVEDDYGFNRLIVVITFDLYPFKISHYPEGNDLWDPFNFSLDVFQTVEFKVGSFNDAGVATSEVEGSRDITLINVSQNTHVPQIDFAMADPPSGSGTLGWQMIAGLKIVRNGITYYADDFGDFGELSLRGFRLARGENKMTLRGIGTAKFTWYKEFI